MVIGYVCITIKDEFPRKGYNMDGLMKLYRKERVNDFFKNYAIKQIEVAYRILEYLEPDSVFKPKNLDKSIMDLFLKRDVMKAVHLIVMDIDYSQEYPDLEREGVEFANEVLEDYFAKLKKEKLSEREQLLIRLGELDKELSE